MLLRDGECFLSRATLAEANQSELLSERGGVRDTDRLRVNGRRRSHACFCVISPLRLSQVMLRWMIRRLFVSLVQRAQDENSADHQTRFTNNPQLLLSIQTPQI